jgi:hypothetical protein
MAVNSILSNSNAILNLQTTSIVINGKSFNISSSPTDESSSSFPLSTSTTALIIGLVVGLVGGLILVLGTFFGYRKYNAQYKHRPLIDNSNDDNMIDSSPAGVNTSLPLMNVTATNNFAPVQHLSRSAPVFPILSDPVNSPPTASETARAPSAAVSITMLHFTESNNGQRTKSALPVVELLKFD